MRIPDANSLRALALFVPLALLPAACQTRDASSQVIEPRARRGEAPATWKGMREQNVVLQKRDYTCGAAALATLLKFYFGETDITEQILLDDIFGRFTEADIADRIARGGLSMLDLRDCARRRGYEAEGLKLELGDLSMLEGPVLVHMLRDNMAHFAILRAIRGDKAYLADPSYGNLTIQTGAFAKEWTGYVLCVDKEGHQPPPDNPLALDADPSTSAPTARKATGSGR